MAINKDTSSAHASAAPFASASSNEQDPPVNTAFCSATVMHALTALKRVCESSLTYPRVKVSFSAIEGGIDKDLAVASVTVRVFKSAVEAVAFATLLLPTELDELMPLKVSEAPLLWLARDARFAYDAEYQTKVHEGVGKQFDGIRTIEAETVVVPVNFNWSNDDDVHALCSAAVQACLLCLDEAFPGNADPLATRSRQDTSIKTLFDFVPEEIPGIYSVSSPVRSDVYIKTVAETPLRRTRGVSEFRTVSECSGHFALRWAANVDEKSKGAPYSAQFVITHLRNRVDPTLRGQLLALLSSTTLLEARQWQHAFLPDYYETGDLLNLRDFSAVNVELEAYIKGVCPENTTTGKPTRCIYTPGTHLIDAALQPGLSFTLEVGEATPDAWLNQAFVVGASSTYESEQRATSAILDAANALTHGAFSQLYVCDSRVTAAPVKVHVGHYTFDGKVHDLRTIDYLALLNLYNAGLLDFQVITQYAETFYTHARRVNPAAQLATRYNLLDDIVHAMGGHALTLTGYANQVTFTGEFLRALRAGFYNSGQRLEGSEDNVNSVVKPPRATPPDLATSVLYAL